MASNEQLYTQIQARHILVDTKEEADKIRAEIMQGKDADEILSNFRAAAKQYSKCPSSISGGDLGTFGRGVMVPEFEIEAFELPEGEVSQPVRTKFGWHLIYVISKM